MKLSTIPERTTGRAVARRKHFAPARRHGFTIVELLVVIVVIAILAAISIVAYTGIQNRARDTSQLAVLDQVRTALELYYADNERYPDACFQGGTSNIDTGGAGIECEISFLKSDLVPKYINNIPDQSKLSDPYRLAYTTGGPGYSKFRKVYGLSYKTGEASGQMCRYLSRDANKDWWYNAECSL